MRALTRFAAVLALATLPLMNTSSAHAEGVKAAGCPAYGYLYAVPASWTQNFNFTCPDSSFQADGVAVGMYAQTGNPYPYKDVDAGWRLTIIFATQRIGNQIGTWSYHAVMINKQRWYVGTGVILSASVWENYSEALTYHKGNIFTVITLIDKHLDHKTIAADTKITTQILHSVLLS